jgi:peptidoglycan/LPS O-acetylase OafA/YrhL
MRGTGEPWRLGHRPALDGVRGIAILLVMCHHAGIPGFTGGGAAGVTVFFVLSGFLITELLLEERERTGRISLPRFYERRARRLLPAMLASLAVIVALSTVLGAWWFRWSVLPPVLLYVSNWVDPSTLTVSVLHMWSLAVEEQFYLVWPVVIMIVARHGRRLVLLLAVAGVVLSVLIRLRLIMSGSSLPRIYGGTDSNAFALMLGAALAAWQGSRPQRARPGMLLVVASAALAVPIVGWPFAQAVVFGPVFAAGVGGLLVLAATGRRAPRLLGAPALRWFGVHAYGLYLIHGPLGKILDIQFGLSWPWHAAIMFPVSMLLAAASYRWVEAPLRRGGSSLVVEHQPCDVRERAVEEPDPQRV